MKSTVRAGSVPGSAGIRRLLPQIGLYREPARNWLRRSSGMPLLHDQLGGTWEIIFETAWSQPFSTEVK
jgi:hypothetical protein